MSRRRRPQPFPETLAAIRELLEDFEENRSHMSVREQVVLLGDLHHLLLTLGVSVVHEAGASATSGSDRIAWYMSQHLGQVIGGDELAIVSGISEYGRRTRELRVEDGHRLFSGVQEQGALPYELKPDEYIYTTADRDEAAADLWRTLNEIRQMDTGFQGKALALLKRRLRQVVTIDQLRYISGDRYEPRRIRELRTEKGYMIATQQQGFPGLQRGDYMLLSDGPRHVDAHDRAIPQKVENNVFDRDAGRCRMCGWTPADWNPVDPRIPELHHIVAHEDGGESTLDNLVTLCSKCHDEVHAERLVLPGRLQDMPY